LEEIEDIIREYSEWQVITNTPKSILAALRTQERYRISFWDALILQAALDAGVSILYSEDLAHGQHYGTVQVVNPLLEPVPE
jgi:predicted nucleic acid-binding protein